MRARWLANFFFFFSSRRRHTRCSRDWSSDVCSSDLEKLRTLSALSGLITSARDTQEVFKALARAATMLLGAGMVHVWVDDPRAQVLRVRGTYGLDPEFERPLTEYEVISYGSGMAGGTFTAGRPEFIFGVRTSPRWKNRRLAEAAGLHAYAGDRKSTRLNSSHGYISYAVFCLKKKKNKKTKTTDITE